MSTGPTLGATRGRPGLWVRGVVLGAAVIAVFAASDSQALASGAPKKCSIASPTGTRIIPLTDQGRDRPFILHVPSGYDRHRRLPLVLNLHGSGSSGSAQMDITQMAAEANRQGVAVVAPDGGVVQGEGHYTWNVPGVPLLNGQPVPPGTPNDERYLLHVIRTAERKLCIDPGRITLAGYSGGARMASQTACDQAGKITSVAAVGGLRAGVPKETSPDVWAPDRATCRPDEPVPVMTFHGTADTTNPFPGNDDPRWGYSVDAAVARWAKLDRCKRKRTSKVTSSVTLISHSRCGDGATVSLYREEGAGHTWPGSAGPALGPIDTSIDATKMILRLAKAR